MLGLITFGLVILLTVYAAGVLLYLANRCEKLEAQIRRMGGDPNEDV